MTRRKGRVGVPAPRAGNLQAMEPLAVSVRPERAADRDAIRALPAAVFAEPDEGLIVDGIRGTGDAIEGGSLVALDGSGTVIGHLLASKGAIVGSDGVERPQPWPDEAWQALKLPAYTSDLRGRARYAAPFKVG